jgi:hypothetical protein
MGRYNGEKYLISGRTPILVVDPWITLAYAINVITINNRQNNNRFSLSLGKLCLISSLVLIP